ncbi:MAG: hypothetical protein ACK46C_07900, partial [Flavobacteriales bacterium]
VVAWLTRGAAALTLLMLVGILVSRTIGAWPSIRHFGLPFLWTSEWDPVQENMAWDLERSAPLTERWNALL